MGGYEVCNAVVDIFGGCGLAGKVRGALLSRCKLGGLASKSCSSPVRTMTQSGMRIWSSFLPVLFLVGIFDGEDPPKGVVYVLLDLSLNVTALISLCCK